ncbi:hypothetical protein C8J56DRAFT_1093027 [Mycena floridula]|nr:hypothetical protein C8J56DRAFT_1093027 [Mycena floridula]
MYTNPFDWSTGNGQSTSTTWNTNPTPSLLGALPFSQGHQSNLTRFYLTSFNPDALNCTVIGPQHRPVFYIGSDPKLPGYTTISAADGHGIALIEWQKHPLVEVRGTFAKQRVKDWLRLSTDRRARSMEISGRRYLWAPKDNSLDLSTVEQYPKFMARILRGQGVITLEMTDDALQLGLLESLITAATLLQCGRNVD